MDLSITTLGDYFRSQMGFLNPKNPTQKRGSSSCKSSTTILVVGTFSTRRFVKPNVTNWRGRCLQDPPFLDFTWMTQMTSSTEIIPLSLFLIQNMASAYQKIERPLYHAEFLKAVVVLNSARLPLHPLCWCKLLPSPLPQARKAWSSLPFERVGF